MCLACVERDLTSREVVPGEARAHFRQGVLAVLFGGIAWVVTLLAAVLFALGGALLAGWTGMRCDDKRELKDSMRAALEADGPVLLDVHVDKTENCYPMIPAGAAARDMVG